MGLTRVYKRIRLSLIAKSMLYFCLSLSVCNCTNVPNNVAISLDYAGDNAIELQKVIDHYQDEEDSLKLKTAFYLISNLKGHQSQKGLEIYNPVFDQISDTIRINGGRRKLTYRMYADVAKSFNSILDSIETNSRSFYPLEQVADIHMITSEFIIENIDLAFKSYNKIPIQLRCNQKLFTDYILPYRLNTEPLESGLRESLHKNYSWVYPIIKEEQSVVSAVCAIMDTLDLMPFS